jgi:DNA-binding transcriptional regulator GbsR (MarR family)
MAEQKILNFMRLNKGKKFCAGDLNRELKISKPILSRNLRQMTKFKLLHEIKPINRPTAKRFYFLK